MKSFNFKLVLLMAALMFLVISCERPKKDYTTTVEELNDVLEKAMLENDYESSLALYTDDAYSLPSYSPMLKGIEAIKEQAEKDKEAAYKFTKFELNTLEVWDADDFVIEVGTYSLTMEMPEMPEPYEDNGKYVTIYEVQEDGSLKIKVDTWNSDVNPWEMMQGEMEHEEELGEKEHGEN